jgi:hypothetical protein
MINVAEPLGTYLKEEFVQIYNNSENISAENIEYIESIYNDNVFLNYKISSYYALLQKLAGNRIIEDVDDDKTVYVMDNGQLTYIVDTMNIQPYAELVIDLNEYLNEKKTDFLYIQAPFKIDKYDNQLPYGMEDTTNENADIFVSTLRENEVDVLDLRDEMYNEHIEYTEAFYNTDHHWKFETALWALQNTMTYVNNKNNNFYVDTSPLLMENLNTYTIEQCTLGSQGRRVGEEFAGVDDFTYYLPIDEGSYICNYYNKDFEVIETHSGSFEDALINESNKLYSEDIMVENYYGFLYGNQCVDIENNNKEGNILIIKDSFGVPFSLYSSLLFNKVTVCDCRTLSQGELKEIIDTNDFDYVFMIYNPGAYYDNIFEDLNDFS